MAVVVPAHNVAGLLPEQLAALAEQQYDGPWQVIVVDNLSTDRTADVARSWRGKLPRLTLVEAAERRGPSYARNAGAAATEADLLCFCDGDDVVAPGWLAALVQSAHGWDAVGGRLDEQTLNPPWIHRWQPALTTNRLPHGWWFLPFAGTGNLAIWREALDAVGGFDEGFTRPGSDDIEFSWRLQLSGRTLGYAPEAVVRYRHRDTLPQMLRQAYHRGQASAHLVHRYSARAIPGGPAPSLGTIRSRRLGTQSIDGKPVASGLNVPGWLRHCAIEAGIARARLEILWSSRTLNSAAAPSAPRS